MKRELAALETAASPVLVSVGRRTRSGNSGGAPQHLAYKRVKRDNASVVAGVSKGGEERLGRLENGQKESEVNVVSKGEDKLGSVNEKEKENELGDGEKESVDNAVLKGEERLSTMNKKENNVGNGKKGSEDVEIVEVCVEVEKGVCDEGLVNLAEVSSMLVEEVRKNEEENDVNGNVGSGEVQKEAVVEESLSTTPLKMCNGRGKKVAVEGYQRRFTRSALKCNGGEEKVLEEMMEEGKVKETMVEDIKEVNGEVKGSSKKESARRVTRSSLAKGKEDGPDSCLTDTTDSVVPDKEDEENDGISNEEGEFDTDKHVEDNANAPATLTMKLEMKMRKQIAVTKRPKTVRELFETGLLEGCPVYYDAGKGPGLRGRIRAIGICCPCKLCCGRKVIAPSLFEIHATNTYKRAVEYIFLENGRSLIQILKACKTSRLKTSEETVKNAIGPLPERKVVVCQNCKEPFITMDTECSDPVCSSCVMSNSSSVGPVYSCRKLRSFAKCGTQSASSCGKLEDCSLENPDFKSTSRGNSAKKQEEAIYTPMMCSSLRTERTSEAKTSKNFEKESSKKSSKIDDRVETTKRLRKETLTPKATKTPPAYGSSGKKTSRKITKKDLRLHKLVFEDDVLPDGTELGYYARGKKLLDGYKQGFGIFCNCCETVISASQFESHAGCAARRKPYCYIYTSNGVSLHELSINLVKGRMHSAKFNDDLCSICADGGDLLLCDGCPRAFHTECASLSSIPNGKWYCKYCENMFEREKFVAHNANAFAAGRVSGVDPIEQITKRSIRIVNNVGSDVSSCILCREFDFSKSGFGPRTIILCDQCEKEYHVGCLKDHDMADLTELPDGKWFCSLDCGRIDSALQNLLVKGAENLPESLMNVITRKNLQNVSNSAADVNLSWRLLSGKIASPETRPLLSQAVAIFHESFAPIVEVVSGHDLIPAMVYGRNVGGQEYGGMYCAVLTLNTVVVSAAIFRVFGSEVAELPLVATSSGNHGKGYFQALFACIERLLTSLNIKTFVLPAAEEAESIWTDRFGFKKMTADQLRTLKSSFWSMVRFQGTSMLHKPVPECMTVTKSGE